MDFDSRYKRKQEREKLKYGFTEREYGNQKKIVDELFSEYKKRKAHSEEFVANPTDRDLRYSAGGGSFGKEKLMQDEEYKILRAEADKLDSMQEVYDRDGHIPFISPRDVKRPVSKPKRIEPPAKKIAKKGVAGSSIKTYASGGYVEGK